MSFESAERRSDRDEGEVKRNTQSSFKTGETGQATTSEEKD